MWCVLRDYACALYKDPMYMVLLTSLHVSAPFDPD